MENRPKSKQSERIRIDEQKLRERVRGYLHSPAGRKVLRMFDSSLISSLIASGFGLVLGIVLLPTVVGTRAGLIILRNVFTLKAFRELGSEVRGDPEKLFPLIAHGII